VRYEFRNEANNLISDYRIVNQIVYRFLSFIQEFPSPVCRDILNITPAKDRGKLLDWEGGVKEKVKSKAIKKNGPEGINPADPCRPKHW